MWPQHGTTLTRTQNNTISPLLFRFSKLAALSLLDTMARVAPQASDQQPGEALSRVAFTTNVARSVPLARHVARLMYVVVSKETISGEGVAQLLLWECALPTAVRLALVCQDRHVAEYACSSFVGTQPHPGSGYGTHYVVLRSGTAAGPWRFWYKQQASNGVSTASFRLLRGLCARHVCT